MKAPAATAGPQRRITTVHDADLALLAEMARDFASVQDLRLTLSMAVERATRHLEAAGGALFLLDEEGRELRCEACWGATEITGLVMRADQGIVGRCVQNNVAEIVRDVSADPSFNSSVDAQTGFTTRSILCAPMRVKEQRIGAIELVNKLSDDALFDEDDLRVLEVVSMGAALAIINTRMAEALVEQERVRRELELAAEIQRELLPARREAAFPVHGVNRPARTVSGDFYDFFALPDGRIAFCLGDVSGKGMNAALLMVKTASIFRCLGREGRTPGYLMARVNAEIRETATRGMFVTMVAGIYDPADGFIRLANAGHEPPLIVAEDGSFRTIPAEAPPLGLPAEIFDTESFPEQSFALDGRILLLFSDGVTEGYAADGQPLGVAGVRAAVAETVGRPASERIDAVSECLVAADRPLRDDATLLIVDDAPRRAGHLHGPRSERMCKEAFRANAASLKRIRELVIAACQRCAFGKVETQDMVMAVDEAGQNIIRHAYRGEDVGDIVIEIVRGDEGLIVLLRDYAPTVDPATVQPRDLDDIRPGGLGTHIMRETMDEVLFLPPPEGRGNLLKLVKRIGGKVR